MKTYLKNTGIAVSTFLTLSLALGATSRAEDDLFSKSAQESPGQTKYQVLQKLYTDASVPADASDIDGDGESRTKTCVVANPTAPDQIYEISMVRLERSLPPAGPVFPGEPTKTARILAYGTLGSFSAMTFFDSLSELKKTSTDLIEVMSRHGYFEGSPNELRLRKSNGLVSFFNNIGNPNEPASLVAIYGYCFQRK